MKVIQTLKINVYGYTIKKMVYLFIYVLIIILHSFILAFLLIKSFYLS